MAEPKFKIVTFEVSCRDSDRQLTTRAVTGPVLGQYGVELWSPDDSRRVYRLIHLPSGQELFCDKRRAPVRALALLLHERAPDALKGVTIHAPELRHPEGASEASNTTLRQQIELYGQDLRTLTDLVTAFRQELSRG